MRPILYFAYGSNMLTERLRSRIGGARPLFACAAPGWRLGFGKRGRDLSGKATITPDPRGVARGVVFEIGAPELAILDGFEGPGYDRAPLEIAAPAGGTITAQVYVVRPDHLDAALRPFDWYLGLILAGAREHGLPQDYIARLGETPAIADPAPDRPTRREALGLLRAGPAPKARSRS